MNKEQEIDAIHKDLNQRYTKQTIQDIYESMIRVETIALVNGDCVKKVGYGTLDTVERKARKGVKPKTTEKIDIDATVTAIFRPGKPLKELLNS